MQDVYKNIEDYNPSREFNAFIVFDDMISDRISIKRPNPIITELFIEELKLNISAAFITQAYFQVTKDVRQNCINFIL